LVSLQDSVDKEPDRPDDLAQYSVAPKENVEQAANDIAVVGVAGKN